MITRNGIEIFVRKPPITIVSTKDITRAPPLLPFPLLEIFNRIL